LNIAASWHEALIHVKRKHWIGQTADRPFGGWLSQRRRPRIGPRPSRQSTFDEQVEPHRSAHGQNWQKTQMLNSLQDEFASQWDFTDPAPFMSTNKVTSQALNRVILSLYRDGRDLRLHNFQDWALEQVRKVVQFDSAWWGNAAMEPGKIHWIYLFNCDASIMAAYPPYLDEDFFRAALMANPGKSISTSDLITRQNYVRTALYRNVGKRYCVEWSLGTLLVDAASSLTEFLTLWRHDPKTPFSEADRHAKELLMPHLVEAFRGVRLRHFLKEKDAVVNTWALADDQGFLREASPAFVAHLQTHWAGWQGNRLPEPLASCIVEGKDYKAKSFAIKLKKTDNLRFLELKEKNVLDKLSPRETEIIQRYAEGQTYQAIAHDLELSPVTVRNHISHSYKKLNVNNKAEMANLLNHKRIK
jgi:DNA-binding CsgD family transcriptional regulator